MPAKAKPTLKTKPKQKQKPKAKTLFAADKPEEEKLNLLEDIVLSPLIDDDLLLDVAADEAH